MLTPLTVLLVMSKALVSDLRWTKELRQKKLIKKILSGKVCFLPAGELPRISLL